MTLEDVSILLKVTGLPFTYLAWPEGKAPPLPFICYLSSGANNFVADGHVYFSANRIRVELYTRLKSPETEAVVEAALADIPWTKDETYIDSEKCYRILYEIEV